MEDGIVLMDRLFIYQHMPKVHVRASQCAHIASLDADTSFIVDAHGPRWVLTSTNNQSMVVFAADIISMEEFHEDVIYELNDAILDMFKTCAHGVVVISIRARKVSFTHDYDQLIRRVSSTTDVDRESIFHRHWCVDVVQDPLRTLEAYDAYASDGCRTHRCVPQKQ